LSLLCRNIYDPPCINNPAVNHGKTYENAAIQKFEEGLNLKVQKSGLVVCEQYPYLGCSPDGIIYDISIVEIKCPFNGRNSKVLANKFFPFLEVKSDGNLTLKRGHNYYYQIIGQLAITKRIKCYFIVYTFVDLFVEEIYLDTKFFDETMLPKLRSFYENNYRMFVASKL